VEALSNGKGDINPHRSPVVTVLAGPGKATVDQALQVDGVFTAVLFGDQV